MCPYTRLGPTMAVHHSGSWTTLTFHSTPGSDFVNKRPRNIALRSGRSPQADHGCVASLRPRGHPYPNPETLSPRPHPHWGPASWGDSVPRVVTHLLPRHTYPIGLNCGGGVGGGGRVRKRDAERGGRKTEAGGQNQATSVPLIFLVPR